MVMPSTKLPALPSWLVPERIGDGAIYLALLRYPHDEWRARHQWVYCALRDRIAEQIGMTDNEVQDMFEQYAATLPEVR